MTHLRILHAEDQDSIAATISSMLRAHAPDLEMVLEIRRVATFRDFKAAAFDGWDAILLDLTFPDSEAPETLAWTKKNFTRLGAILVITGNDRDDIYFQALQSGALRALLKPDFTSKHEFDVKPRHLLSMIYENVLVDRTIKAHYGTPQT